MQVIMQSCRKGETAKRKVKKRKKKEYKAKFCRK